MEGSASQSGFKLEPTGGEAIQRQQRKCSKMLKRISATLEDEATFKQSHVKSLRVCLTIFQLHLKQFDDFLASVCESLSSSSSALNEHYFHKSREMLNAYDNILNALRGLATELEELTRKTGRVSRFFSSINLRKRFDQTSANLTECMKVLLECHTQTIQYEHAIFGLSLRELMKRQKAKYPNDKVPRILPFLAQAILSLGGTTQEGIFRIPPSDRNMQQIKRRIELSDGNLKVKSSADPHDFAGLLKLWLRELPDPVVPLAFYDRCLERAEDVQACVAIVKEFPTIHRRVLYYVIDFLRNSILPAESKTKMGIANLGTLFGAILINNPDLKPVEALSKMQNQALFIKNLLEHLDTHSKSRSASKQKVSTVEDHSSPERRFWAQFPLGLHVSWEEFEEAFLEHVKLKSLPENDIRLLKYVLDSSNTGFVNIHKYDEFVKGFGPLEACLRNIKLLFCKPWWHGYLSSEEADFLLRGMPAGTFLGRMSVSNPGSFAIAFVDSSGKVNHILVKSISTPLIPNGRGIYLPMHEGRAIVFTDLFSLVESKRFGFLKTPYQSDLIKESGFHGTATREEALELLTDQPPGTYLLRLSQSNQNCLAIAAVAEEGNVYHSLIKRMNGKYGAETDAECTFASIAETIASLFPGLNKPCPNARSAMYDIVKDFGTLPPAPPGTGVELELTTPLFASAPAGETGGIVQNTMYLHSVADLQEFIDGANAYAAQLEKGKEKGGGGDDKNAKDDPYYGQNQYLSAPQLQRAMQNDNATRSAQQQQAEEPDDVYGLFKQVDEEVTRSRVSNKKKNEAARKERRKRQAAAKAGGSVRGKSAPAETSSRRKHTHNSLPDRAGREVEKAAAKEKGKGSKKKRRQTGTKK